MIAALDNIYGVIFFSWSPYASGLPTLLSSTGVWMEINQISEVSICKHKCQITYWLWEAYLELSAMTTVYMSHTFSAE
jgi:hypothetical protein